MNYIVVISLIVFPVLILFLFYSKKLLEYLRYIRKDIFSNERVNINTLLSDVDNFINNNDLDSALKILSEEIESNLFNPKLFQKRGFIYLNLNQFDQSIEDYQKVLKLDPDNPTIEQDLGYVYMQSEEFEKAIEFFHLAYEKNSRNKELINLINACKNQEKNYYSPIIAKKIKISKLNPIIFYPNGVKTRYKNKFRLAFKVLNYPSQNYGPNIPNKIGKPIGGRVRKGIPGMRGTSYPPKLPIRHRRK